MRVLSVPVLLLSLAAQLVGQQPASTSRAALIQRALASTVTIEAVSGREKITGSGVVISPLGIIATAAHVVDGATAITVRNATTPVTSVTGIYVIDRAFDFALIRAPLTNAITLRLGDSDSLTVGQRILAIGAPLGLEATVTDGLVSAQREFEGKRLLQISVPVSPGSSGGPIMTEEGRVVGIVVSGIRGGGAENLNFALPINYVRTSLAAVAAADPVPIAEAITVTRGERLAATRTSSDSGVPARRVVNDSLGLNWAVLDGVSFYSEDNDGRRTISSWTRYTRTMDPSGVPVVERNDKEVWNQGYHDRFRDDRRDVIYWNGDYKEYYRRTPVDPNYRGFAFESHAEGGRWSASVEGGSSGSATLPRGILPPALEGATIAALPDSLPQTTYVWVAFWDTTLTPRTLPARFDFGRRDSIDVPIIKGGTLCDPDAVVDTRKLPVVWVTATVEATQDTFPVLAHRPHLRMDARVKCVSSPYLR